jgi:hypothetical protein
MWKVCPPLQPPFSSLSLFRTKTKAQNTDTRKFFSDEKKGFFSDFTLTSTQKAFGGDFYRRVLNGQNGETVLRRHAIRATR